MKNLFCLMKSKIFLLGVIVLCFLVIHHYKAHSKPKAFTAAHAAEVFTNSIGMKFVYIKPGTFIMGSPTSEKGRKSDETQHKVTLTKGFYMQTTEVTQAQWRAIMSNNPAYFNGDDRPVEQISWNDVQEFIVRLNKKEGTDKYRLPMEAEWEYACRAGGNRAFANGGITQTRCKHDPNLNQIGWYCGNSGEKHHPVAQKRPNAWGLYDMHGNVREWCQDRYGAYPSNHVTDPKGVSQGSSRVNRGGGWSNYAKSCRSANRYAMLPDIGISGLGFRLVGRR